jgi:hypothetical protein
VCGHSKAARTQEDTVTAITLERPLGPATVSTDVSIEVVDHLGREVSGAPVEVLYTYRDGAEWRTVAHSDGSGRVHLTDRHASAPLEVAAWSGPDGSGRVPVNGTSHLVIER